MTDKDILDTNLGGITVRNMTALTFLQWLSKKVNGLPAYRGETQEIMAAIAGVSPMSRRMPDEEKIRLIRKLEKLDIPLV